MFSIVAGTLTWVDAFSPAVLPKGFLSVEQLVGIDLLLMLLPAYILFSWGLLHRRSHVLLGQVDALLGSHHYQDRAQTPAPILAAGGTAGIVYASLFNLPIDSFTDLIDGGPLLICLVFWMVFVWVCVGVVLSSRLYVSGLFLAAGRAAPIDLYDQSPLEPFARCGMGDVLVIVGALVLTTVQSIDATFRYQNYLFSMLVAVPAMLILLLRPMLSLHARLRARRQAELTAVSALIRAAPKTLGVSDIAALEALLQRRDRVRDLSAWPINVAMVYRLLVYGVIPPLAWTAAAIVERLVGDLLAG